MNAKNIPLMVLSASGLGEDIIRPFFKRSKALLDNVCIISNSFEWDGKGRAIAIKEPIIHSLNKNVAAIKKFPTFEKIKGRDNILLLGNSLNDLTMVDGVKHKNLIKIGFLDEDDEEISNAYRRKFDVILWGDDPSMNFINKLIGELLG